MKGFKFTACQLMYTFIYERRLFQVLGSRCLTGSALLDCHVLKGFGIYMIGILGRPYCHHSGRPRLLSLLDVNYSVVVVVVFSH